jgi:CBS domain-containing protein
VETISEAASLGEATTKLLELRVGALPVVDEDGGLVGILSVTDVLAEAARRFA